MTSPLYARLAARFLAREELWHAPASRDARFQSIAAIERALRTKARNRRRIRWALGMAAVAAALLIVSFIVLPKRRVANVTAAHSPATQVSPPFFGYTLAGDARVTDAAGAELDQAEAIAAGNRIVSKNGAQAVLSSSRGSRLTLEANSELWVVDAGTQQIFALHSGALQANVSKLAGSERFVVRTSDAEVEVRGTSFRVALAARDSACADGTRTRLTVYEGVVMVRHADKETSVTRGGSWPNCETVAAKPTGSRSRPATSSASNLAEQNDQFAAAIASKRSGQTTLAVNKFERFLATYPQSPLAESAEVERMKLLATSDPTRAKTAARAYLATRPRGFARLEAEALVLGRK